MDFLYMSESPDISEDVQSHRKGRDYYLEGIALGRVRKHEELYWLFRKHFQLIQNVYSPGSVRVLPSGNWAGMKKRSNVVKKQSLLIQTVLMPGYLRDLHSECSTGLRKK